MMELIGWTGSILLAICGLPQAVKSYVDGHARGVSWLFLFFWGSGEVMLFIYSLFDLAALDLSKIMPLILNYGLNIFLVCCILRYKISPRREERIKS